MKVTTKEKIQNRSMEDNITIVKKLNKAINQYQSQYKMQREEIKSFFQLLLFSSHRCGELIKLTVDDVYIHKNMIVSPKEITKTKEDYQFPIPQECLEYIISIESGLLFPTLSYGSLYMIFQRIVKKAEIELYKNKKLSIHDTRSLMLNIMIRNGIDSMLADSCLEHKQRGIIKHYLDFTYEDKVNAYNKYWNLIRN